MNWQYLLFDPRGRIGQRDYWIGVALLILGNLLSGVIPLLGTVLWFVFIWVGICVYGKRLHDTGRSAVWHAVPWAVTLVITGFAILRLGSEVLMAALSHDEVDPMRMIAAGGGFIGYLLLAQLVWLVYTIWLGVAGSDLSANRYGDAPPLEGRARPAADDDEPGTGPS